MNNTIAKAPRTAVQTAYTHAPDAGEGGQACVLMLLEAYGLIPTISTRTVEDLCRIKPGRTTAGDLVRLAAQPPFLLELKTGYVNHAADLRQILFDERYPIILVNHNGLRAFPQGQHWLLVMGYRHDDFLILDPLVAEGVGIWMPAATLQPALVKGIELNTAG